MERHALMAGLPSFLADSDIIGIRYHFCKVLCRWVHGFWINRVLKLRVSPRNASCTVLTTLASVINALPCDLHKPLNDRFRRTTLTLPFQQLSRWRLRE
jgi:hypothetical protein